MLGRQLGGGGMVGGAIAVPLVGYFAPTLFNMFPGKQLKEGEMKPEASATGAFMAWALDQFVF